MLYFPIYPPFPPAFFCTSKPVQVTRTFRPRREESTTGDGEGAPGLLLLLSTPLTSRRAQSWGHFAVLLKIHKKHEAAEG